LFSLLLLLLTHYHFEYSKLHFSTLFAPFALCPLPFYTLEASILYFDHSLCFMPTSILFP
jgi:hypothetical protein